MDLNRITLELLREEAYVLLCREAILARIEVRNREKASLTPASPVRATPAPAWDSSPPMARPESDPDVALYTRLSRIGRIESWVQKCLRVELVAHLEATNAVFQGGMRIQQALNEWEFCVRHVLPDSLAEFARELRGLRQAAGEPSRRAAATTAAEFVAVRRIAARVEDQQLQIGRIAAAIAGHAQKLGATDVLPPSLPNFLRMVWVDWLTVVPVEQVVSEVTRIESEVRTFLNHGLASTLEHLQGGRNACSTRQEHLLQEFWQRLREHAQSHFVEERELDTVLDSLSNRYEPEISRRESSRSQPFLQT